MVFGISETSALYLWVEEAVFEGLRLESILLTIMKDLKAVLHFSTYLPELGMSPSMGCAPGASMNTPADTLFHM